MKGPDNDTGGKNGLAGVRWHWAPGFVLRRSAQCFLYPTDRAAYRRKVRNRLGTSSGRPLLVPIGADGHQIAVFPLLVDFLESGELVEKFVVLGEEKANHHDF